MSLTQNLTLSAILRCSFLHIFVCLVPGIHLRPLCPCSCTLPLTKLLLLFIYSYFSFAYLSTFAYYFSCFSSSYNISLRPPSFLLLYFACYQTFLLFTASYCSFAYMSTFAPPPLSSPLSQHLSSSSFLSLLLYFPSH